MNKVRFFGTSSNRTCLCSSECALEYCAYDNITISRWKNDSFIIASNLTEEHCNGCKSTYINIQIRFFKIRRMKMEVNKIYNMDCLEGMKQLEDGSIDLIIIDPPYNISKENDSRDRSKLNSPIMRRKKPLKLIKHFIEIHSNENEIILDCFMGSGTTALACKQLNRKFIGFEINDKYCKMANNRLNQEVLI